MTARAGGSPSSEKLAAIPVLGIDACSGGWVGVLDVADVLTVLGHVEIAALVSTAAERAGADPAVVAVDMPIGLADTTPRAPDALARKILGRRASTVFSTPIRPSIEASTYPEANTISRDLTGSGISKQAYALRAKIFEVETWARTRGADCTIEVHPEVSYVALAGTPLPRKKSWSGAHARLDALRGAGLDVPRVGEAGEQADVDDVLDAAVAAWTARRFLVGSARPVPSPPVRYSDDWPCAIWA